MKKVEKTCYEDGEIFMISSYVEGRTGRKGAAQNKAGKNLEEFST
jgi:hypothetical protein